MDPHNPDKIIRKKAVQIEKKSFEISLRENQRGGFLRIDEQHAGKTHRNTVIIPATGIDEFIDALDEIAG